MSIVALPHDPGEKTSSRIVGDITLLERYFRVKVTDSYATSGHAAGGEHPVGLAADIVPDTARGGTWDDVDRLAAFAAKFPNIFRFVGYDGRFGTTAWPNHGRGNHLHLSWHGGPVEGAGAKTTSILSFPDLTRQIRAGRYSDPNAGGIQFSLSDAAAGAVDAIPGADAVITAVGGAVDAAGSAIDFATDPIGWIWEKGRGPLLTIVLVFSALTVAGLGIARMTGVRAPLPGGAK